VPEVTQAGPALRTAGCEQWEANVQSNLRPSRWLYPCLVALASGALAPPPAAAGGVESLGNTDGVLTWHLGTLEAGASKREAVIFAYAESHDALMALVAEARRQCEALPDAPEAPSGAETPDMVWVRNEVTDFALDKNGAFFWEGRRQALACPQGGQLSRFGYYLRYDEVERQGAGTPIGRQGALENLRVIEPVRAVNDRVATGVVETADQRLQLRLRAVSGKGTVALVDFCVANVTDRVVDGVELSVYANIEAAHTHENNYSILDSELAGVLVVDPPSGTCVAMAGWHAPAVGHVGVWASEQQLRDGAGVAIEKWTAFEGVPETLTERLARSAIPHPPAPPVEPKEPETGTLTEAEAQAVLERDWLFQAGGERLELRAVREVEWAEELVARLSEKTGTRSLAAELAELGRLRKRLESRRPADTAAAKDAYLAVRRVKRRIAFANPLLDFTQVLFIDQPYTQGAEWPHEARHRNGMMAVPGGRLLVLDGLHPGGAVRKLAPERPGSFWRPDLSFDAQEVLFCYKAHDEKAFHLYKIGLDGSGLRQLTSGDYDDLDPIYLPDGHVMFSTTRCNTYVRCMPYTYSYVLARCDADGGNIYVISRNNEPDYLPTLLDDGRVIYTRWEYTDKALWRIQSLWTVNPDGTNTAVYWGNQSVWPDLLIEPRSIPGSRRIMFTGAAHHNWFAGSIGILDPLEGRNFPHGLTKVTVEVEWPECGNGPVDPIETPRYHRAGAYDAYKTPYPLSEEDFLVSARSDGKFRLYLMDVYGNRELLYEGAHHIWHAMPIRPRIRPITQPDRVAWPGTGKERRKLENGVLYSANVYQGVPELPQGRVKHLRVIQMDARTYSTWTRDARFSGPGVSILQDDGVKRILGTAPVEADGSVHFEVPPGKAFHFQLLDEHYRALQTMRSFTGVMPGERRGCVGCHEMHSVVQPNRSALALRRESSALTPPPWGTASIGYERMVQPVLDQYCGKCHQGEGKGREKLDLTLRPGNRWFFKEPYITLVGPAWMGHTKVAGAAGIAGAIMCENFALSDPDSYATLPPMRYLSYNSRLIEHAMSGRHNGVRVDPVSLRQLIGWVDANCPYRGDEEIRAMADPDFPGIDWLPVRPRCKTAPRIERP